MTMTDTKPVPGIRSVDAIALAAEVMGRPVRNIERRADALRACGLYPEGGGGRGVSPIVTPASAALLLLAAAVPEDAATAGGLAAELYRQPLCAAIAEARDGAAGAGDRYARIPSLDFAPAAFRGTFGGALADMLKSGGVGDIVALQNVLIGHSEPAGWSGAFQLALMPGGPANVPQGASVRLVYADPKRAGVPAYPSETGGGRVVTVAFSGGAVLRFADAMAGQ